jgi:hypothetical protein
MKIVDSNNWVPRHKLNLSMPIRVYWGLTMFYYILASVIYHLLNKDSYFNEDD